MTRKPSKTGRIGMFSLSLSPGDREILAGIAGSEGICLAEAIRRMIRGISTRQRDHARLSEVEVLAKPSAIDAALKIQAALISASAAGTTGEWVAKVRLNQGGAIDCLIGQEQRIRLV